MVFQFFSLLARSPSPDVVVVVLCVHHIEQRAAMSRDIDIIKIPFSLRLSSSESRIPTLQLKINLIKIISTQDVYTFVCRRPMQHTKRGAKVLFASLTERILNEESDRSKIQIRYRFFFLALSHQILIELKVNLIFRFFHFTFFFQLSALHCTHQKTSTITKRELDSSHRDRFLLHSYYAPGDEKKLEMKEYDGN